MPEAPRLLQHGGPRGRRRGGARLRGPRPRATTSAAAAKALESKDFKVRGAAAKMVLPLLRAADASASASAASRSATFASKRPPAPPLGLSTAG